MVDHAPRHALSIFATKQMDFVPEVSQAFGRLEKIPFGPPVQIEAFMN